MKKLEAELPEILVRHFKQYHSVIDAFFEVVAQVKHKVLRNQQREIENFRQGDASDSGQEDVSNYRDQMDFRNLKLE